ncbi:virulence-associated E family protein [Shewanella sp. TC10]|uniref:virulence-associated E family protein n=1 Tax=Shewanella sp. TC10 TaxID=1419739 RepID=UPI001E462D44|nr:virulence-associated E family protein [Shewanella sp. TC10]
MSALNPIPAPTNVVKLELPEETEKKRPKFEHVSMTTNGEVKPKNTANNLKAVADFMGIEFKLNLLTYQPEILDDISGDPIAHSYDQTHSYLVSAANITGLPPKAIDDHLKALCENNPYHPIKNWLDCGTWDGIERVRKVIDCLPVKDRDLSQKALSHWLVGCVASLYEDSFKSKLVPVLQGSQSYRKTAYIERIAKVAALAFLEGAELNPDSKDSVLSCIFSWVVELGELERTNRNSQGSLKAFISKDLDTVRPPYARGDIKKRRQTHFIASVNGSDFLKDDTGSSRFVVLEMTDAAKMDELNELLGWHYDGTGKITLVKPELLKQFWLEVKVMYEKGHGWMLPDSVLEQAKLANDSFNDKGNWYQYILERYIQNDNKAGGWITAGQLVDDDEKMNVTHTKQVGKALAKLHEDGLVDRKKGRSRMTFYQIDLNTGFATLED